MNIFNNSKKGFTLIELLVVISIIGLLSSVILASLNTARSKARDAQRISDLKQIQLALELYRDENGVYPDAKPLASGYGKEIYSSQASWKTSNLYTALVGGGYIAELPVDPLNTGAATWEGGYTYTYSTYAGFGILLGSDYD
ncbi:MAG TPA: prepilin-type N-terminal cleavage/methylation domain-containing protein, partial [Euryarchaeota archaeon]|nr:prepilin-type N-terminal cleavage/methylation domain-containing protein [Euryarchaeota archaeon]